MFVFLLFSLLTNPQETLPSPVSASNIKRIIDHDIILNQTELTVYFGVSNDMTRLSDTYISVLVSSRGYGFRE